LRPAIGRFAHSPQWVFDRPINLVAAKRMRCSEEAADLDHPHKDPLGRKQASYFCVPSTSDVLDRRVIA
jgi:hypothetical protein